MHVNYKDTPIRKSRADKPIKTAKQAEDALAALVEAFDTAHNAYVKSTWYGGGTHSQRVNYARFEKYTEQAYAIQERIAAWIKEQSA